MITAIDQQKLVTAQVAMIHRAMSVSLNVPFKSPITWLEENARCVKTCGNTYADSSAERSEPSQPELPRRR